jgi:hypothetical protein
VRLDHITSSGLRFHERIDAGGLIPSSNATGVEAETNRIGGV